jgi:hypothetical protein
MRITIIFLFSLLSYHLAKSQGLSMNASGKIEMAEVIQLDSINNKTILYQNAIEWTEGFPSNETKITSIQRDLNAGKITCSFQFPVYSQTTVGVLKKINGTITYDAIIEVKDFKYRYSFTNFIFHYYKQDRNYKYVDAGKKKNLEDMKASGWQKLWSHHRLTTAEKLSKDIEGLKARMQQVSLPSVQPEPAKKEVKWEN